MKFPPLLLASLVVVSVTAFIPQNQFESGISCLSRRSHSLGPQITICKPKIEKTICLPAVPEAESSTDNDPDDLFDVQTTIFLVGGQSLLIGVAAVLAVLLNVPNYGLGASIEFSSSSIQQGFLAALPLGLFVFILDRLEDRIPALKDVTKATQRSVLALLGGKFKPLLGLVTAIGLGFAAGFGEEMLFRGVMQYKLGLGLGDALSIIVSSVIFGLLHAVTPLYAFLAWLASLYFGYLYVAFANLAVPIFSHAIYDVGALFYAHWTVSRLSDEEKSQLLTSK